MQQESCEEIQLLISRFVDDEVSAHERKQVEEHVAVCDECAYKLLEYMEMAVLFSETPLRQPAPDLRTSLFREIGNVKEEAARKEEAERLSRERSWLLPAAPAGEGKRPASLLISRLVQVASPLSMAAAALFVFLGALLLGNRLTTSAPPTPVVTEIRPPVYIPTLEAPVQTDTDANAVPPPVVTKVGIANASPAAPSSSYVNATATLGRDMLIKLMQPTPVLEEGDPSNKANWHVVRDPQYGYTISYPPNWWTSVVDNVRYFYPWTAGGTRFAPYWVEMRVSANSAQLSARNGNSADICGGRCQPFPSAADPVWLRRTTGNADAGTFYDEGYIFDSSNIYQLRVSIPVNSVVGAADFADRMKSGEGVWGVMSGRLLLSGEQSAGTSTFNSVLFLNGSDLWLADAEGSQNAYRVTRGYRVRQFAQSPDLASVAFAAADPNNDNDPWARSIYLTHISSSGPVPPVALLSDMEVHDIAWYSDHELLALARSGNSSLAIYRISLPTAKSAPTAGNAPQVERIVTLPDDLSGAKSLAVSPDRQLITFLAPVGERKGTDLYGVRPDGTNLLTLISHSDPVAPMVGGSLALAPESQAIKSYLWADGHLESGGYQANLLFTCGNSSGPFSYPGGYLYSSSASRDPLVDPFGLTAYEPERMQIIPIAYSSQGKVAMAGYMSDVYQRADQIVGLWTADLVRGSLLHIEAQPTPVLPHGVADLQWSPDGKSLIYRETIPSSDVIVTSRYDGGSDFRLMKLDVETGKTIMLYDGERR